MVKHSQEASHVTLELCRGCHIVLYITMSPHCMGLTDACIKAASG